jgi:hypothetical protein
MGNAPSGKQDVVQAFLVEAKAEFQKKWESPTPVSK